MDKIDRSGADFGHDSGNPALWRYCGPTCRPSSHIPVRNRHRIHGCGPVTSILAAAPEVMLVGQFPAELQSYIDFAIGISADSTDADTAEQLSEFLTSTAVDDILAAKGVERRHRAGATPKRVSS
nr:MULTISPECIES: hypothetical protein [Rhizobium]